MCGFAGYFSIGRLCTADLRNNVMQMSKAIAHRGPNSSGVWVNSKVGLALAHQRLAIIDLSSAGAQPMVSSSGRYVIVYNGEFYNHNSVRDKLRCDIWNGRSDTETLLELIEIHGIEGAVSELTGMFAFALFDHKLQTLHLVRDRLGEKPVYYGWNGENFMFASELKAITQNDLFKKEMDLDSVNLYFKYGFIPSPKSIYRNIFKLEPGCLFTLSLSGKQKTAGRMTKYWDIKENHSADEALLSSSELVENHLEKILIRAVDQQVCADVPVGSFLSGGVDSSLITALMQSHSSTQIQTFSIGFDEKKYDEKEFASKVAKELGTAHQNLTLRANDIKYTLPKIAQIYDEPFGDPSALPTHVLSNFAKREVTVVLTGDGGDELFGGYNRYLRSQEIWSFVRRFPHNIRDLSSPLIQRGAKTLHKNKIGNSLLHLNKYWLAHSLHDVYEKQISTSNADISALSNHKWDSSSEIKTDDFHGLKGMCFTDIQNYLPDNILVKVDRASMAASLETRAPFLNHDVANFAFHLPDSYKIAGKRQKVILTDLLAKHLPRNLFERPKMGFGLPVGEWLKGDLREWADGLLSKPNLDRLSYIKSELILLRWQEHLLGFGDWHYFLWRVLMFLEWERSVFSKFEREN